GGAVAACGRYPSEDRALTDRHSRGDLRLRRPRLRTCVCRSDRGCARAMWEDLLLFVAVGFAAQMVDGAIGMAYGVISSSVMLSLGVPPATTSACVHAAETF